MSNIDTVLNILKESTLSDKTKEFYRDKISREGATRENLAAVHKLLEEIQASAFSKLGLTIDMSDPEIKAAQEKMERDIAQATGAYTANMKRLEAANNRIAQDISEDLESLEKLVVASAQAEA